MTVAELLEELREARRVQAELVGVLHHDGEARTRRTDGSAVEKITGAAVPFVIGILLGVASTYAAISGRLATLETQSKQYSDAIGALQSDTRETLRIVRGVESAVTTLTTAKGH